MEVYDFELQIIDYLFAELGHHSILFFLIFFPQFFQVLLKHIPNILVDGFLFIHQLLLGRKLLMGFSIRSEFKNGIDIVESALDGGGG